MPKPIIFMFSGQGSQYYQMGKYIYMHHMAFRKWMIKINDIVSGLIGESIIDHIYDSKKKKSDIFDRTLYSHPAIFMVEYAFAQVLLESGIKPDYVLGVSLGEFTSATLAGIITLKESLEIIIKQAEMLEKNCSKGGMMTILEDSSLYNRMPLLNENSTLASINYHSSFTISGQKDKLSSIAFFLKKKDIAYQFLPVSKGFHSFLIEPAKSAYMRFLHKKRINEPQIPFVSCLTGNILKRLPKEYFWEVIRKPILFSKTIGELEKLQNYLYIDLGPSGTLANFVKYNLGKVSKSESFAICSPFGQNLNYLEKIKEVIFQGNFARKKEA